MTSTQTTPCKRLIIPISSNNEFYSETADYAIIDLNEKLIERIKALSAAVCDLKVYKVSEFNYDCEFYTVDWEADPDNGKVALSDFDGRMECNTLNVTDTNFFWSGLYRHTDVRWETESVPLTALDDPDILDLRESQSATPSNAGGEA